jgi:Tfp pilus assembly protein PilZ
MSWSGLNRRQFPRVIYPCMVKCTGEGDNKGILLTHTENIGEGGLCLTIKKALRLFSLIELELDLLDADEHMFLKGKVVWSVRRKAIEDIKPLFYDIGVEFIDLSNKDQARLRTTVERLIKQGSKILKPMY